MKTKILVFILTIPFFLVMLFLAALMLLSGCAPTGKTESEYWQPTGERSSQTAIDVIADIPGCERNKNSTGKIIIKKGCNVIVYECASNLARISTKNILGQAHWIKRDFLTPDVCLAGQP